MNETPNQYIERIQGKREPSLDDDFVVADLVPVPGKAMVRAYAHDGLVHIMVGGSNVSLSAASARTLIEMIDVAIAMT